MRNRRQKPGSDPNDASFPVQQGELAAYQSVPIAAICAATVAISRLGFLRGRRHTSNGLEYLRSHVPGYAEAANYIDTPAVRDRGLITASGLGDIEFARELFEELNVLSVEDRAAWATIFRSARLPEGAA